MGRLSGRLARLERGAEAAWVEQVGKLLLAATGRPVTVRVARAVLAWLQAMSGRYPSRVVDGGWDHGPFLRGMAAELGVDADDRPSLVRAIAVKLTACAEAGGTRWAH